MEEDVGPHELTHSTLSGRQSTEMDEVMHQLGSTLSDQDVNAVASQHFDAQQVTEVLQWIAVPSLVHSAVNLQKFCRVYQVKSLALFSLRVDLFETFSVLLCLRLAGVGEQVGQRVEASHWDPEAGVSGVGHQTAPGPAEIQRQQQN